MNSYPTTPVVAAGDLPSPFVAPDGSTVDHASDWPGCAREWRELIVDLEYGGMPPSPEAVDVETLNHAGIGFIPGEPRMNWYRINCRGGEYPVSFCVKVIIPKQDTPCPVIICGDACWHIADDVLERVVSAGCAFAIFNRTELAEDLGYSQVPDKLKRSGGLYDAYPDRTFGALAAWAWGYHRCVDLLQTLPFIDSSKIAVSGHSRGGKTVLLAGVTDKRIALVNDNGSCAGGGAVFRYVGDSGETLDIANVFPSWFAPGFSSFLHREEDLPFDQHCLLAAIAPRPLLLTYALDDRWSNPEGMVQCAWAANEVYRFLGQEDNLAFHLRPGKHAHSLEDWDVLLDFIAWKWQGRAATAAYNKHPYTHLQPAFSWRAPR